MISCITLITTLKPCNTPNFLRSLASDALLIAGVKIQSAKRNSTAHTINKPEVSALLAKKAAIILKTPKTASYLGKKLLTYLLAHSGGSTLKTVGATAIVKKIMMPIIATTMYELMSGLFIMIYFNLYWVGQYALRVPGTLRDSCFVLRPDTRSRHTA